MIGCSQNALHPTLEEKMAVFLFAIEVLDDVIDNPTSLSESEAHGLAGAFKTTDAVVDATYIGLAKDYHAGTSTTD